MRRNRVPSGPIRISIPATRFLPEAIPLETRERAYTMAFGGIAAVLVLCLKDGIPIFDYNYFEEHSVAKGDQRLPPGEATLESTPTIRAARKAAKASRLPSRSMASK